MIDPTINAPANTSRHQLLEFFRDPVWLITLLIVIIAAMSVRETILFRSAFPAGMDAGYYPVQARALLEHGQLEWTDVPLIFALDAALAKCAMVVAGWDIDSATLWASRVVDTAAEPFAAIAIFFAAWIFSRGARKAILGAIAATSIAICSPPLIRMIGDFEKQSLAMMFMCATFVATWCALRNCGASRHQIWRWIIAVGFLALTALSHAGTFAATALGVGILFAIWAMRGGIARGRGLRVIGCFLLACFLTFATVWWLAPRKANAILDAPAKLFSGEDRGPGGDRGPSGERGPGGPGGIPSEIVLNLQSWMIVLAVGSAILFFVTRSLRRVGESLRTQARADEAFAFAMFFTALALCCPWVTGEYRMRLALMVPIPLSLVVAFVLTRKSQEIEKPRIAFIGMITSAVISVAMCVAVVTPVIRDIGAPGMVQIDEAAINQLRAWRTELGSDQRTIIVARHGLEFWAGFAMGTKSRQTTLRESDFDTYEHLYLLMEQGGRGGPGGPAGRGGPGGRGGMRDDRGPPQQMGGNTGRPDSRRQREFREEIQFDEQRAGGLGPMNGPMNGPMRGMRIPQGATIIRKSDRFTLWEVPKSARESYVDQE